MDGSLHLCANKTTRRILNFWAPLFLAATAARAATAPRGGRGGGGGRPPAAAAARSGRRRSSGHAADVQRRRRADGPAGSGHARSRTAAQRPGPAAPAVAAQRRRGRRRGRFRRNAARNAGRTPGPAGQRQVSPPEPCPVLFCFRLCPLCASFSLTNEMNRSCFRYLILFISTIRIDILVK